MKISFSPFSVLVFVVAVLALTETVSAAPWIQGVDLPLPREVDPEAPIAAHESECNIYYLFNFPMTCGDELVFDTGVLACVSREATTREECKN